MAVCSISGSADDNAYKHFMMQESDDPYHMQDLKEFNMDCWTTLTFDQWRMENHPDHIPVPRMPTFPSQENEPLLRYEPPIYTTESPSAEALLGDQKRSSIRSSACW